jgi:hypothetical protein
LSDRLGGSYLPMVSLLGLLLLFGPALSNRGTLAYVFVGGIELGAAVLGVLGASGSKGKVTSVIVLALIAVTLQFIGDIAGIESIQLVGKLLIVAMLFRVQSLILRDILPEPSVTASTIVGAIGTYLVSIVYWATIYSLLSDINSSSFQGPIGNGFTAMNFLYYSSITQTTVGYGDIVPVSSFARSLASLQAIIGQLYVAILVAWLVGRAVSEKGS